VVKDPIFSKTKSNNKSVCKVILVVEKRIGGSIKRSDYIPIALWGKKADVANDIVRKGDELMVVGSVAQERWETSGGDKRNRVVVQADKFWVINPSDDEDIEDDDVDDEEYDDDDDDESDSLIGELERKVGEADEEAEKQESFFG
jgi:single-strand DNA-binding protein